MTSVLLVKDGNREPIVTPLDTMDGQAQIIGFISMNLPRFHEVSVEIKPAKKNDPGVLFVCKHEEGILTVTEALRDAWRELNAGTYPNLFVTAWVGDKKTPTHKIGLIARDHQ